MKKFNPEKELNKIKNGNKNKFIVGLCALLLIVVVGYSFALYQVRHSKELTHITIKQFYQNDLDLAVYVDGVKKVKKEDFPTKENGTNLVYTGIKCQDGKQVNASWDYDTWVLDVKSELPNKCNVYFETRYKDESGASYPELYQGLIPITIGTNGEISVANLSQKWYDYNAHEWANAVLVTDAAYKRIVNEDGSFNTNEQLSLDDDILQMYVWIPRYRYKLFNAISGESSDPQMIEIEFEDNTKSRSLGQTNGEWLTHPAFLFGDTELNGIWVGKFQSSDPTDISGKKINEINEITILPNKTGTTGNNILTIFNAIRDIEKDGNKYNLAANEIDTHLMKNSEWGAAAYLTSSIYGRYTDVNTCVNNECEVWVNNVVQGTDNEISGGNATGCVGTDVSAKIELGKGGENPADCPTNRQWNIEGIKASTTRNMYGIYDMSSTTYEYVMGVLSNKNNEGIYYSSSGFDDLNKPDSKYYDIYKYDSSHITHERGHLGDATRETLKYYGSDTGAWYGDYAYFPYVNDSWQASWFLRGGSTVNLNLVTAGIFSFVRDAGKPTYSSSFRVVLTAQDGTD